MNYSSCQYIECTIYDDTAYVISYFIVCLYTIFTLYLLYGSIKFRTFVTIGLYSQGLPKIRAAQNCFHISGCYFLKSYKSYELAFQYFLLFFAIVNIIITIARFHALHRYGPKPSDFDLRPLPLRQLPATSSDTVS